MTSIDEFLNNPELQKEEDGIVGGDAESVEAADRMLKAIYLKYGGDDNCCFTNCKPDCSCDNKSLARMIREGEIKPQ